MPHAKPRRDTLALTVRAAALACADEVETQLERAGRSHHTGVHRARKALTRLRALLSLLHTAPRPATDLELRARGIARIFSRLRDAQAAHSMARRLIRPRQTAGREAWRPAIDTLEAERDRLLETALSANPGFTAQREQITALRAAMETYEWNTVRRAHFEMALRRSARRVRRARKETCADPTQKTRHRLRRRLRRLLLQIHLLRTIADDKRHPHAARQARKLVMRESKQSRMHKRLVDTLGDERDLQLLRRALSRQTRVDATERLLPLVRKRLSLATAASDRLIG